jgi:hypothetical protein
MPFDGHLPEDPRSEPDAPSWLAAWIVACVYLGMAAFAFALPWRRSEP